MKEVIYLNPNLITVESGRYRKDKGDIKELADSIQLHGQMVPIIISPEYILFDGERRLLACKYIRDNYNPDHEVMACIVLKEMSNDKRKKVIEIVTNKHRKQFTWEEDVVATRELLHLMQEDQPNISMKESAVNTGMSVGKFNQDVQLADMLEKNPELFKGIVGKSEAMKVLKQNRINTLQAELTRRHATKDYTTKAGEYILRGNCLDLIKTLPSRSIYAIISDPMYGVDIQTNMRSDKRNPDSLRLNDTMKSFRPLMDEFAQEADRVLNVDAAVCIFTAIENVEFLNSLWSQYGFQMDIVPAIWFKQGAHYTNTPNIHFGKSYEFIVYGLRGIATLVKPGASNVLQFSPVTSILKDHAYEKPIELMDELLNRFCLPGQSVLDFQCGSGTTIIAAIKRGCKAIGFELDDDNYTKAIMRVHDALKLKAGGQL